MPTDEEIALGASEMMARASSSAIAVAQSLRDINTLMGDLPPKNRRLRLAVRRSLVHSKRISSAAERSAYELSATPTPLAYQDLANLLRNKFVRLAGRANAFHRRCSDIPRLLTRLRGKPATPERSRLVMRMTTRCGDAFDRVGKQLREVHDVLDRIAPFL